VPVPPAGGTDRDRHVAVLALDDDPTTIAAASAAWAGSWSRSPADYARPALPLSFAARGLLGSTRTVDRTALIGFATTFGPERLFLHPIDMSGQPFADTYYQNGACAVSRRPMPAALGAMDGLCLAFHTAGALDPAARPTTQDRIAQIGAVLDRIEAESARVPKVLLLLIDAERLARRMGVAALPGVSHVTPPEPAQEIVDGYVIEALRMRELLAGFPPMVLPRAALAANLGTPSSDLSGMRHWASHMDPSR
jgi:hypothetical protein